MNTIPRTDPPAPPGLIAREWAIYAAQVLPSDTSERGAALVRLGYYAGAASALSAILNAPTDDMEAAALTLSVEILEAVDRDLIEATRGEGRYAPDRVG